MAVKLATSLMQGPLFGILYSQVVYGIVCAQTWFYFQTYKLDPLYVKLLVATIWILQTLHSSMGVNMLNTSVIEQYANLSALVKINWTLVVLSALGFFTGWLVNLFFVWRIWLLGKSWWISSGLALLATTRLAIGLVVSYTGSFHYTDWTSYKIKAYPYILGGVCLGVVVDCLITFTTSWYLLKGNSRTFAPQTVALINKLLHWTLSTGAITMIFAIAQMITFIALPRSLVFMGFVPVLSQLYASCLLAILNTRKGMRSPADGSAYAAHSAGLNKLSFQIRETALEAGAVLTNYDYPSSREQTIEITTEVIVETDELSSDTCCDHDAPAVGAHARKEKLSEDRNR